MAHNVVFQVNELFRQVVVRIALRIMRLCFMLSMLGCRQIYFTLFL